MACPGSVYRAMTGRSAGCSSILSPRRSSPQFGSLPELTIQSTFNLMTFQRVSGELMANKAVETDAQCVRALRALLSLGAAHFYVMSHTERPLSVRRWRLALCASALAAALPAVAATPEAVAVALVTQQLADQPSALVACVQVDGQDAPMSIVAALARLQRTVVPASQCTRAQGASDISRHRETAREAIFVSVRDFRVVNANRAEVSTELFKNGKWAIQKVLELEQTSGSWRVVRVKTHVES